jgi:hypothetical protein
MNAPVADKRFHAIVRSVAEEAFRAIRSNFLPGLILQAVMLVGVAFYLFHDGFRSGLAGVAEMKRQMGYAFAFVSYVIAGAALPETMKILCFQGLLPNRQNFKDFAIAAPFFGMFGVLIDALYRLQITLFGAGNDLATIIKKVAFDQFVFSPFLGMPVTLVYFAWAVGGFRWRALLRGAALPGLAWRVLTVQSAGWIVWIPAVSIIYALPPLLQIPAAVTVTAFWVLILTTIRIRQENAPNLEK